eukprot:Plantae.Rhodophyta-Purpureofilum_apyrenoidigerum.ctg7356.p1 GENE.Plantae.Rhodophyta-Purpureofilum_apyrenoidigerum.ctg7356~~Plantae.Rhodophyta-Purpureofilum_apyrenoidigerum.ctg7356.p1  ORF type:complete len:547 (-),score=116.07 Plantae.Rhodophyta-Purpureofilum_apyrenoidigerum.ctg7356:197-1675(-)
MEAERAKLAYERAQLEAEKRKLEHEQMRILRMKTRPETDPLTFRDKDEVKVKESSSEEKTEMEERKEKVRSAIERAAGDEDVSGFMRAMGPLADIEIKKVSSQDVQTLRDHVFSMETFYVTQVETSTFGDRVVFRGNLRTDASKLLNSFEGPMKKYGLSDRVRLFLMEDPASVDENRPVIIALPKEAEPREAGVSATIASFLFFLVSGFTTLGYGVGVFGNTPQFLSQLQEGRVDEIFNTLPISIGFLSLVIAHELGHRVAAYFRGVKLGLPFFLPSLQIGSYGTITPLNSFPKTRSDFFDVVAAGPAVGMSLSLLLFVAGLFLTGSSEATQFFPQVPTVVLRSSMLLGSISRLILPSEMLKAASLAVHPLTMIGTTGVLVNAVNLIPIGRLDGGRIVQALYGRIVAGRVSGVTLLLQGLGAIVGNSPLLLFWGLIAVFFQSRADIPCQDEVTEPDNTRSIVGLVALLSMVLVLAPFPADLWVNNPVSSGTL